MYALIFPGKLSTSHTSCTARYLYNKDSQCEQYRPRRCGPLARRLQYLKAVLEATKSSLFCEHGKFDRSVKNRGGVLRASFGPPSFQQSHEQYSKFSVTVVGIRKRPQRIELLDDVIEHRHGFVLSMCSNTDRLVFRKIVTATLPQRLSSPAAKRLFSSLAFTISMS